MWRRKMRRLPDIHGDDWLPEDDDKDQGSFSEDYDYDTDRQFDPDYDNYYR
jgi:hypothetical protein